MWFGPVKAPREHYEAQVVGARHVPEAKVLAIEVGFHTEHPDPALNTACLAALVGHERRWRKALGPEAVAAPFIADRHGWQRLSETWPDPDLSDPEIAFEIAAAPHGLRHRAGAAAGHRPGYDRVTTTVAGSAPVTTNPNGRASRCDQRSASQAPNGSHTHGWPPSRWAPQASTCTNRASTTIPSGSSPTRRSPS